MALPVAKVEIAFTTAPLTAPGAWTDVSAYVRSINIKRGRDHELAQSRAGECTIRLTNTDRRFDPLYTSSPYSPNILPMRQIRVTATHNAVTYPLFYGYIEDWAQTWPGRPILSAGDGECVVRAVDGFKLLSLYQLRNTYAAEVLADGPVAYWKLDEQAGASILTDYGPNGHDLIVLPTNSGITMNATPGPLVGGTGALDAAGLTGEPSGFVGAKSEDWSGTVGVQFPANPVIEFWVKPRTFVANRILCEFRDSGGQQAFSIAWNGTTGKLKWTQYTAGFFSHTPVFTLTANVWSHVVAVHDGSIVKWYVNGVLVEITTSAADAASVFAADAAMYVAGNRNSSSQFDGLIDHVAMYQQGFISPSGAAAVPFSPQRVAAHYAAVYGAIAQTDAGAQITILLEMMGWPAGLRTIDTGAQTMASFDPVGSALGHLLRIAEDSERGLLQMSADGKVTFHSRTSLLTSTGSHGVSQATLGDAGAELPYEDLDPFANDDQDLWTRVIVTRDGGAPQLKEDATAVAAYGPRTLDIAAPSLASDADCQLLAQYLLFCYRAPKTRPTTVKMALGNSTTLDAAVLVRETHHDRVTVVRRPQGGGSAISFDAHVEGLTWEIDPVGAWAASIATIPDPGVRFVFDECRVAPGTLDGGVTETNSGTGADCMLSALAFVDHPGVLDLSTGTTTTGRSGLLGTSNAVQLGALETVYQGMAYLPILSTAGETYTVRFGLGDSVAAESVDFIGFRYTHGTNSGRWQGVTRSNSTESTVDTGVAAVAATWVKFGLRVNMAGTSVQFYVDDVATGAAITTNIPTGASRLLTYLPGFIIKSAGTTARSLLVDRYAYILGP